MTNTTHADSATEALITEVLEPVPQALPTVNARISPRGGLDVLSRAEIARLRDATAGGLHELLRRCALAVLTSGSASDDPRAAQELYPDFDIQVLQQDRGVRIDLHHAPAMAFVDGKYEYDIRPYLDANGNYAPTALPVNENFAPSQRWAANVTLRYEF